MSTHRTPRRSLVAPTLFFLLLLTATVAQGRPTTPHQAELVVTGWLADNFEPLGAQLGRTIADVAMLADDSGEPACYLVRLSPAGFVIVPGDDLVEPILGFISDEDCEPSPEDPLMTLVVGDVEDRLAAVHARSSESIAAQAASRAQTRWRDLIDRANLPQSELSILGRQTLSDVRVAPLLRTKWAQGRVCSQYCYNYYTPNHYLSGCVATAMAQLMYYHRYPAQGIGRRSYTIGVQRQDQVATTRGGDATGGPYRWNDMVPVPDCSTAERQRQAIGALCYDAGLAVRMEYGPSVSLADAFSMAGALRQTFAFSNSINGVDQGDGLGSGLMGMINPNLDAGYPVLLAITGSGGHAVVADGYGYDPSTSTKVIYHHINMGWGGYSDVWYNLPNVASYNKVITCVYNIFTEGSGEIISGRVVDTSGRPIPDAVVTGRWQTGTAQAVTNHNGIYALVKLPSADIFTLDVEKPGRGFGRQTITTGTSRHWETAAGNRWAVDFIGTLTVDCDGDSDVDFADFACLAGNTWGYSDLAALAANWLNGITPPSNTPGEVEVHVLAE